MNVTLLKTLAERIASGKNFDDILPIADDAAKFALEKMANIQRGIFNAIPESNKDLSFYRSLAPQELEEAAKRGTFKYGANVNVGFPEPQYSVPNLDFKLVRFPWLKDTYDLKGEYTGAGLAAWAKKPIPFEMGDIIENPSPLIYRTLNPDTKDLIMQIYRATGKLIV